MNNDSDNHTKQADLNRMASKGGNEWPPKTVKAYGVVMSIEEVDKILWQLRNQQISILDR